MQYTRIKEYENCLTPLFYAFFLPGHFRQWRETKQLYQGISEDDQEGVGLGGDNARFLGEVNQFGHGFSMHLLHDPATVNFDCLKGNPPL